MSIRAELASLRRDQWMAITASVLGWTLDAFDYFLMVFMFKAIARDFHSDVEYVSSILLTLTLAARPLGGLLFGWLADRFGRRPILMIDILLYSIFEFASAFASSLGVLIGLRILFGFAMGGEWGIGASLAMESIPPRLRGLVSGLLQEGYAFGYLLASLVFYFLFDAIGWRGMFMVGLAPAALVLLIRLGVPESPAFAAPREGPRPNPFGLLARHWKRALYVVVLMTAFNFFSHGTQDLYPTFLQVQHGFDTHRTGVMVAIMNVGAITGGLLFGALSERIGRRRAIVTATLLALPLLPLWAYSRTMAWLTLGAFLMQVAVQGAWGIVPAHLNELAPEGARGMFPGVAYQAGNFIASVNGRLQPVLAGPTHNYSYALAIVTGITATVLAVWTWIGPERKGVALAGPGGEEEDKR